MEKRNGGEEEWEKKMRGIGRGVKSCKIRMEKRNKLRIRCEVSRGYKENEKVRKRCGRGRRKRE